MYAFFLNAFYHLFAFLAAVILFLQNRVESTVYCVVYCFYCFQTKQKQKGKNHF